MIRFVIFSDRSKPNDLPKFPSFPQNPPHSYSPYRNDIQRLPGQRRDGMGRFQSLHCVLSTKSAFGSRALEVNLGCYEV